MIRRHIKATIIDQDRVSHKAVMSNKRGYYVTTKGQILDNTKRPAKVLKAMTIDRNGRRSVYVGSTWFKVDKIVAGTYLVTPQAKEYTINHIDGDLSNNKLSNLEYISLDNNPIWSLITDDILAGVAA